MPNARITPSVPSYVLIEPTSICNMRCPMCFQSDKSFTKKPFMGIMSIDLAKNILGWIPKINRNEGLKLTYEYFCSLSKKELNLKEHQNFKSYNKF